MRIPPLDNVEGLVATAMDGGSVENAGAFFDPATKPLSGPWAPLQALP